MSVALSGPFDAPSRMGRHRYSRTSRRWLAVTLCASAGPFTGASPVGTIELDWLWCAVFAGAAAYLSGSARRGPLLVVTLVAVLSGRSGPAVALGAAAVVSAALSTRDLRRKAVFTRGVSGGLAILSLLAGAGDLSTAHLAAVAFLQAVVLASSGLRHCSARRRRRVLIALAVLTGAVVVSTAAGLLGVRESSTPLRVGTAELRLGLSAARTGDVAVAADHLEQARLAFRRAQDQMERWGVAARAFPLAGQQINAVVHVLDDVGSVTVEARRATQRLADEGLEVRAGTIDVELLRSLHIPLSRLTRALDQVIGEVDRRAGDPLVPQLRDRLDDVRAIAVRSAGDARRADQASVVLPDVLGAAGRRRYLVLFTSPAESRGRFGFPASYAEVTFDHGRFLLGEHGSTSEVLTDLDVDQGEFALGDPQLRPYVQFGASRDFLSSTIPPDFPTAASSAAAIWAASGRVPVDGVVRMDPASLAPLLALTGPVAVDGLEAPLTAATVEQFLLVGQYVQFPDDQAPRREVLEDVANETFERLEVSDLPGPRTLVEAYSPLVRTGHLTAWLRDAGAQRLIRGSGVDGGFAAPPVDGLLVTSVNALGNKIDSFLTKELRYRGTVDEGTLAATLEVEVRNGAPASGLPNYVIGSFRRPAPPRGTNRTTLLIYTAVPATDITVDGAAVAHVSTQTAGRWLHQLLIEIPPGASKVVEVELAGELPDGPYQLEVLPSGATSPDQVDVDLELDGRRVQRSGVADGSLRAT